MKKWLFPLPTSMERKLESLLAIFQKIAKKSERAVVIVEGKKDCSSLRKLGVEGKIICVKNSGKVLSDLLDQVQGGEVILLLDFDDYGKALAKSITQYLEGKRIKANSVFWREIKALVGRNVKDIEGIPSYLEKLKNSLNISS